MNIFDRLLGRRPDPTKDWPLEPPVPAGFDLAAEHWVRWHLVIAWIRPNSWDDRTNLSGENLATANFSTHAAGSRSISRMDDSRISLSSLGRMRTYHYILK